MLAAAATLAWPAIRLSLAHRQPMTIAVLLSIGVTLVCASVDITLDIPAFAALGAFLMALVWSSTVRETAAVIHRGKPQDAVSASRTSTGASAGVPATSPVA